MHIISKSATQTLAHVLWPVTTCVLAPVRSQTCDWLTGLQEHQRWAEEDVAGPGISQTLLTAQASRDSGVSKKKSGLMFNVKWNKYQD